MNARILSAIFLILANVGAIQSQTVSTQFGSIQGAQNGNVYQFLGIPYAKPPVNDLRWKAPENPTNWSSTLATTSFAPVCPQKLFQQGDTTSTIIGNEDCLYLNVWTPQVGAGNRPVLVFIHGGGNQQGSANEVNGGTQMYFGKNMAERGDAVIVTIQYRLGPLGFLVHPGLEPENANGTAGNYAVLDQILALKWVQNNIANFGGDPTKVMIFGESAGGINVGNLLTTPLAAGLFQRACIQSAMPVVNTYSDSKTKGINYVADFTTTGNDVQKIAYMRSLPSDSLVKYETSPLSGGAVQLAWQPVIDNLVFSNYPLQTIQSGVYNKVPLIIGSNADEMSLSAPPTVLPAMVTALINASVPAANQATATALYPPGSNTTQAKQSYIGLLTDSQFTATTRRTAQCVSQNQTEPVWRYFFSHKHTLAALANLGSYHGMELFYVFNNWENATAGSGILFKPADDSVQVNMLNYWVNFAKTGNPNGTDLVAWPQYNATTDCYLEIKATPNGNQCGLRTAQSDLWDDVVNFVPCTSSLSLEKFENDDFKIYPNPTQNIVHIDAKSGEFKVELFDFTGKNIFESTNAESIDFGNLSPGIYLIQLQQGKKISTFKVVKQD
jgi:para-nitrobenzyl esterase